MPAAGIHAGGPGAGGSSAGDGGRCSCCERGCGYGVKLAIFPATSNLRSEGYFPCQGVSADQIRHWLKSSATEIGVSVARLTLTEKEHLERRIARDYTIGSSSSSSSSSGSSSSKKEIVVVVVVVEVLL